jgi:membrane fusion protein (multidrug efflux system)
VVKGQTLYQVDPSTYQAVYDRAVATAASTGALARRYQALVSDSVVSKQQRDDAVAAWRQAQADVQSARSIFSARASMPRSRAVSAAR